MLKNSDDTYFKTVLYYLVVKINKFKLKVESIAIHLGSINILKKVLM